MIPESKKTVIGFIPANRGFFSAELAAKMRAADHRGHAAGWASTWSCPAPEQTKAGCVENRAGGRAVRRAVPPARRAGIVIGAVNFGDEQAAAWTVRQARLDVPVLIFGCQEEEVADAEDAAARRVLRAAVDRRGPAADRRQLHAWPAADLLPLRRRRSPPTWTGSCRVCRVVDGVRNARYGQIGTRPDAFWTCRFDEKQLQRLGADHRGAGPLGGHRRGQRHRPTTIPR